MQVTKGGQTGINGEWYEGGQFLPSSPATVKGEFKTVGEQYNATRKQEVAPYVWQVPPTAESRSIYRMVAGVFGKIVKGKMTMVASDQTFRYYKMTRSHVQELCDRWNSGERWV